MAIVTKFMQMSRIKENLTSFVCNVMFLKHSDNLKIFIYVYCIYILAPPPFILKFIASFPLIIIITCMHIRN